MFWEFGETRDRDKAILLLRNAPVHEATTQGIPLQTHAGSIAQHRLHRDEKQDEHTDERENGKTGKRDESKVGQSLNESVAIAALASFRNESDVTLNPVRVVQGPVANRLMHRSDWSPLTE
ncbi:GTP:AMP phosphotransferase AK3 [Penicillium atrosanguineum]|uniref:GTP:AMP phosphotransferase AK3 n=1 Tax=Penicillium atrosanguineum TaxID=1132637 RepID=UPI00239CD90E|nr:GTP:AMP phosphotransferase AK3 [Penicillium atrosanguineum]KAJ5309447.1 GTP:AMP phosphotransferase AK3 [Penicillium atrosanguineum]